MGLTTSQHNYISWFGCIAAPYLQGNSDLLNLFNVFNLKLTIFILVPGINLDCRTGWCHHTIILNTENNVVLNVPNIKCF